MTITDLHSERQKRDRYRLGQVARVFAAFECLEPCCVKNCNMFAEYRIEAVNGAGLWACQKHLPTAVERFMAHDPKRSHRWRVRPRWMHLSHGLCSMKPYQRSKWRKQYRAGGGQYF